MNAPMRVEKVVVVKAMAWSMDDDAHALSVVQHRRREVPGEDTALHLTAVAHPEAQPTAAVLEQVVGERNHAAVAAFGHCDIRRGAHVPVFGIAVANHGAHVGRAGPADQNVADVRMVVRIDA